jgi:hypothetical protein
MLTLTQIRGHRLIFTWDDEFAILGSAIDGYVVHYDIQNDHWIVGIFEHHNGLELLVQLVDGKVHTAVERTDVTKNAQLGKYAKSAIEEAVAAFKGFAFDQLVKDSRQATLTL